MGGPATGAWTFSSPRSLAPGIPRSPGEGLLDEALRAVMRRFVLDSTVAYGAMHRDLTYAFSEVRCVVTGNEATPFLAYDGSVIERATGQCISARGDGEVDVTWTGCAWLRGDLHYGSTMTDRRRS